MPATTRPPDSQPRAAHPGGFDLKQWLDDHVVPLLAPDLTLYSFFVHGQPPQEILVFLLARSEPDDPGWAKRAHQLLTERGFHFDHLREVQLVPMPQGLVPIFGGDGTPLYNEAGMVSVRLARKQDDGINLIVQLGAKYSPLHATAIIKQFFASFDTTPLDVIQRYRAVWGQA